ncbi:MAG: Hcp family type VI secretion system effector [Puniceicoccaceae bacterium]
MTRRAKLVYLIGFLVFGAVQMEAPAFLKFDGIDGESKDTDHEDWIPIEIISMGLVHPTPDPRTGDARPIFKEFTVEKQTDKATAPLLEALATGAVIPNAEIDATEGKGRPTYLKYKLTDAIVTSYTLSGDDMAIAPSETISLNYSTIQTCYWQRSDSGVVLLKVESFWDIPLNRGGSSSGNASPTIEPIPDVQLKPGEYKELIAVVADNETVPNDLIVTADADNIDLVLDLEVSGTENERTVSFRASSLYSGATSINLHVSDGVNTTTRSFAVLVDVEMTPFEAYMMANFSPEELDDPQIASPISDPDKDNIPTVVEYALVTNPNEYTLPQQAVRVTRENTDTGPVIRLNYRRRTDDPNIGPIPWMAPESLLFEPASNNPLYEEKKNTGENPFYEDVEGIYPIDPDGKDVHMIRMQVDFN